MMPHIHRAAWEGYSAKAAAYSAGRPGYPPGIIGWLQDALRLKEGSCVLDLGAGTGKLLPYLRAAGARLFAAEPVPAMLEELKAGSPDVVALEAAAEDLPLESGSLDAVVCAQSFHWFANEQALFEIRRVLKPGGALGLIWNMRDESVPWVAELARIMAPYEGNTPRHHRGEWRRLFPAPGFSALREERFPHSHAGPPERVIVDRALSVSFIAALPPKEQAKAAAQVRKLIAQTPALAGKEEVSFPYETRAYSCIKNG
ncbi:MAG TPA: methyltransferase domain-containing protein [Methylocella sp.]|nr:methyltransferase domain-containing protein [Methylocella sp.]